MARKNESVLNLLATLPWWISVVLALLSYIFLKYILPNIPIENNLTKAFLSGIASMAPIIAMLLLITAGVSAILSWQKGNMLDKQKSLDTVSDLNWKKFEALVGEAYRRQGYFVLENSSDGPDGGVDLRLRKDGELVLVQCKHWKSQKVNVKIVRELYGIMASRKANRGIVVTYGSFTQDAKDFANGKPLDLVDGQKLMALIESVKREHIAEQVTISEVQKVVKTDQVASISKTCALCGSEMVLRKAKTGKYAGQQFWGCKAFPKCRGILRNRKRTSVGNISRLTSILWEDCHA